MATSTVPKQRDAGETTRGGLTSIGAEKSGGSVGLRKRTGRLAKQACLGECVARGVENANSWGCSTFSNTWPNQKANEGLVAR